MSPRAKMITALLVGPVVAAADQLASYLLVYEAARRASNMLFAIVSLVASALIATAFSISFLELYRSERSTEVDRFLAIIAVSLNAFFLIVVVVGYGMPAFILRPTD